MYSEKKIEKDFGEIFDFEERIFNIENKYWLEIALISDKKEYNVITDKIKENALGILVYHSKKDAFRILMIFKKDNVSSLKLFNQVDFKKFRLLDVDISGRDKSFSNIVLRYKTESISDRNIVRYNLATYYSGRYTILE